MASSLWIKVSTFRCRHELGVADAHVSAAYRKAIYWFWDCRSTLFRGEQTLAWTGSLWCLVLFSS